MKKILAVVLVFFLVSCGVDVGLEETEVFDVTPTREVWQDTATPSNFWNLDCLEPEEHLLVVNQNPCLSGRFLESNFGFTQERPARIGLIFLPNQFGVINGLNVWYEDGGFKADLTYWSGNFGYSQSLQTDDSCHVIVVKGRSTVTVANPNADAAKNFYVEAFLYTDDGRLTSLGQHPLAEVWVDDFDQIQYDFRGERSYLFPFYFDNSRVTVGVSALVGSVWELGNHGSTFIFEKFAILRMPDFSHCEGIVGM